MKEKSRRVKKRRFGKGWPVKILVEADKGYRTIGHICKAHSVYKVAFYNQCEWVRGMTVHDLREYRELKTENVCLQKLLCDHELEIDEMNEVMRKAVRPRERRVYVKEIKEPSMSEGRSCELIG